MTKSALLVLAAMASVRATSASNAHHQNTHVSPVMVPEGGLRRVDFTII